MANIFLTDLFTVIRICLTHRVNNVDNISNRNLNRTDEMFEFIIVVLCIDSNNRMWLYLYHHLFKLVISCDDLIVSQSIELGLCITLF